MSEMTIGFDAKRIVRNATGLGNYGRTLVADLHRAAPDLPMRLYAPDKGRDDLRCQVPQDDRLTYVYPRHAALRLQRDWWRMSGIAADLRRDGVTLYHGLTGELPMGLRKHGVKGVVTIHDLIFMRHPEYYHRIDTQLYRWKFRTACREASHIIAISERTKQDIMELGGVAGDRITVVYQSCHPRFADSVPAEAVEAVRRHYALPDADLVLSVGTIEERKNLALAVRAIQRLPNVHLVAVGRSTPYAERLKSTAGPRVHFLHGVSDDELAALYQMARVFVYPSRYEGFGIPIIEAINAGLPVVAATGSCLEEAGGPDCLYVDPDDDAALADAIGALLAEPGRQTRIDSAQRYVARFAGTDVARQVLEIYRRLTD